MTRTAVTKALVLTIGVCLLMLVSEPSQVAVGDWPWSPSVTVNDDSTSLRFGSSIAVDRNGNAFAVWADARNGNWDIYFSYRPAGGPWSPNVRANDDAATRGRHSPTIAVDSRGKAYALWVGEDTGTDETDIYFAYRASGGDWTTAVKVNDDTGRHLGPSIAVDPTGNAYAVWMCSELVDEEPVNQGICFSYRPRAGSWSAVVKVNDTDETDSLYSPSIAVDTKGNAYAVWLDGRDVTSPMYPYLDIYVSYRPAGGPWGPNVRVNDDVPTVARGPTIAVDGSGNAYAVWVDEHGGGWRPGLSFAYRPAGGDWSSDFQVNDDGQRVDRTVRPDIAVDANGNAYAVWAGRPHCDAPEPEDCPWGIYFSYRPSGGVWGTNLKVNEYWTTYGEQSSIAADESGNCYVVWRHGQEIQFAYWPPRPGDWAPYKMMLPIVFGEYHSKREHW